MTAHGSASGDEPFLAKPFEALTRFIVRYPYLVLGLAGALGVLSIYVTCTRLTYKTSRLDLLDPKSEYNRLWIEYIREFGETDDAVIVVEGESRDRVVAVLDEINGYLAQHAELFHSVLHEVELGRVRAKGLHYLSSGDLAGLERFVTDVEPIVAGDWSRMSVGRRAAELTARLRYLGAQPDSPEKAALVHEIEQTAQSLAATLAGSPPGTSSSWSEAPDSLSTLSELAQKRLLMNDGRLGFVLLRLAEGDKTSFVPGNAAVDALRALAAEEMRKHPDIKVGLTGLPIMENDEMQSSQDSMTWASIISLAGVACLFVAGFGGLRHAVLANIVLLLGMAWSFGYVTLAVGHLNILSVSFTVTLIGIGIDYGVHFVSRYLELRAGHMPCHAAIVETGRRVSPAITTGALTTAVAFFAAGLTSFKGIAELGIIAGGGLLVCAAAMLTVLPALIAVVEGNTTRWTPPQPLAAHLWINAPLARPKASLFFAVLATIVVGLGTKDLWYDHNLLNMQPDGLESVELEQKLLTECKQSSWYALSMADNRDELLARKAQFLELGSVERVEEIVSLVPDADPAKSEPIARIAARLQALPERPPLVAVERPEVVGQMLGELEQVAASVAGDSSAATSLEQARAELRRLPLADCYARIASFQQQSAGDLLNRMHALANMADPAPPSLEDLPASLVSRFVGQHGRHLLKIYGRGNIWDVEALGRFVSDVRSVDPRATGNPLQAYEASYEMKRSFAQAGLYAALIMVVVVWLDFRSVGCVLLAFAPLVLGIGQMFGLMGWLGIPLNPANLIALPLVLGIGVDDGVHIVHDFREQRGEYRMSASTAVALMVDSLTTIIGFGSLMIANHRGLQSLGRVLTIGVACCLVTSIVVLPPALRLLSRFRRGASSKDEREPAADEPAIPARPLATIRPTSRRRFDPPAPTPAPAAPKRHAKPTVQWLEPKPRRRP